MPKHKLLSRTIRPRSPDATRWFFVHDLWQRADGTRYKQINSIHINDLPAQMGSPGLTLELAA
jgi:hypothetical protein